MRDPTGALQRHPEQRRTTRTLHLLILFSQPTASLASWEPRGLDVCYCAVGTNGLENLPDHVGEAVCSQQQDDAQLVRAHYSTNPPRTA